MSSKVLRVRDLADSGNRLLNGVTPIAWSLAGLFATGGLLVVDRGELGRGKGRHYPGSYPALPVSFLLCLLSNCVTPQDFRWQNAPSGVMAPHGHPVPRHSYQQPRLKNPALASRAGIRCLPPFVTRRSSLRHFHPLSSGLGTGQVGVYLDFGKPEG